MISAAGCIWNQSQHKHKRGEAGDLCNRWQQVEQQGCSRRRRTRGGARSLLHPRARLLRKKQTVILNQRVIIKHWNDLQKLLGSSPRSQRSTSPSTRGAPARHLQHPGMSPGCSAYATLGPDLVLFISDKPLRTPNSPVSSLPVLLLQPTNTRKQSTQNDPNYSHSNQR